MGHLPMWGRRQIFQGGFNMAPGVMADQTGMLSCAPDDSVCRTMKYVTFALLLIPLVATAKPLAEAALLRGQIPVVAYASDADFMSIREAFRNGDTPRIDRLAPRFKDSPLEPYVTYYQLRQRFDNVDPALLHTFLARPDDTPVIDQMRGEWLKYLGKKQRWDEFATEYPRLLNEDKELACYALQMRRRTQGAAVLVAARELWLTSGVELPQSCTPLFDAAQAEGSIGETEIWARVRLALEEGSVSLARQLANKLPPERALAAVALNSASSNPQRYLEKVDLEKATEGQRAIALFALLRLAKQMPQLSYTQWERLQGQFSAEEQSYFYVRLGFEAALNLDRRALEWYQAAGDTPLTERQLAWRTRAALRVLDWKEVWASISAMPPQQQYEGAWRYWGGRALQELDRDEEAEKLLLSLSNEYNFYGLLAAEQLGLSTESGILSGNFKPRRADLDAMLELPAVQRTIALYRMDQRTDAFKEWAWAVRKFDDKQLLTAAEIARSNEMYDRAINTADRTVLLHDFSLRYMAPYRDELHGHIQQNKLEEAWVYGLMRQESRFVTQAKSNVGASGLMQIMPATARWAARKLGIKDYHHTMEKQMEANLALGTYYMKSVLGWFDNDVVLATAAYNAGPVRARKWRGDIPLEGAIYIETIPYGETREYVKKVMSNTMYYARQFGQPPRTLKQRLGVVAPKGAANQQPAPDEQ